MITVDRTSQTFTGKPQPEPDVLLLHTTEVDAWPGYQGGGTAPHDTIQARPGVGIHVRHHRPYTDYAKSLENDPGGVETNKRGVIQAELRGTCDPRRARELYYWPAADDVVLRALADYYRPTMARFGIPARAMHAFTAYPDSYGDDAPQRMTPAAWVASSGIAGHSGAPENAHGDPGAFPIRRFIAFLAVPKPPPPPIRTLYPIGSEMLVKVANAPAHYVTDGQACRWLPNQTALADWHGARKAAGLPVAQVFEVPTMARLVAAYGPLEGPVPA